MSNGLHMLRGGAPLQAMAAAQTNAIKSGVIRLFGRWLVPVEPYHEAFFLNRVLSVFLGAGVPLSHALLVGGVQEVSTALLACDDGTRGGLGFAGVQMGR